MGRHSRPNDAARRLQHRGQPCDGAHRQGEEDPPHGDRRGRRFADRQRLQRLHGPLRLRYDRARQRHGQDDPRSGRQDLVLHHCGLRVRHATPEGGDEDRRGRRRQGRGLREGAARNVGLLVLPLAGARLGSAGGRPRQRGRRFQQFLEGRARIRPHRHDEARGAPRLYHRHPRSRPRDGAGPLPHRRLVLGPQRQGPGLQQALLRQDGRNADLQPGGLLLRDVDLPQRCQGRRRD